MSETVTEGTPGASTPSTNVPTPQGTETTAPTSKAAEATAKPTTKVEDLPDWAQEQIRELRKEAAGNRVKATKAQQDAFREAAKAVGFVIPDDETVDPDELRRNLTAKDEEARTAKVELAVYRHATKHQGDPDALLDSRAFLAKVKDLDPADADFQTKVDEAVKAAVTENPKLRTVQAAGTSSVDLPGGSGEATDAANRAKPGKDRLRAAYETANR